MKNLFEKTSMKNMELKNRFVRSATWEGLATKEGHMTEKLFKVYENLALGDIGLIITSFAYVIKDGKALRNMMGIYDDSFIDEYKRLVDKVHSKGSKIMMQIVYGGSKTSYKVGERTVLGPSAVKHNISHATPKEMSKEDIENIIEKFVQAACRVKKAGFDGVQIHCAHGFLLSQFLDPRYNKRKDEYGGSIENRAKIIYEIFEKTRAKLGNDYHIGIKINSSDFEEGGATFEECNLVCEELNKRGVDSIEISGGTFTGFDRESFFSDYADKIAKKVNCPVILVGGNRSMDIMTNILKESDIEYFSLSRPFICESDLVKKYLVDNKYKPKCKECDKCCSIEGRMCINSRI